MPNCQYLKKLKLYICPFARTDRFGRNQTKGKQNVDNFSPNANFFVRRLNMIGWSCFINEVSKMKLCEYDSNF